MKSGDLNELKRMSTNLYDDEKARINRIIKYISDLEAENMKLKSEMAKLRESK